MRQAAPLSPGFAQLSRRAEWPCEWPGRDALPDTANAGLLLRLAGALFEIDRFQALPAARVTEIVADFAAAARAAAATAEFGLLHAQCKPCLAASLVTLDLAASRPQLDFGAASAIHRAISERASPPIGIGQPVRAYRLPGGGFAATLRLSLSMPMIASHAAQPRATSQARFAAELGCICAVIALHADRPAALQSAA
ncbi:MAG: hypothetical protein HC788_03330 [Sphingopyxis sp.]|nr:hypothetical protein [Sphingopyxis sp.]